MVSAMDSFSGSATGLAGDDERVRIGLGHVAAEQGRERLHAERQVGRLVHVDLPLPLPVQGRISGLEQGGAAVGSTFAFSRPSVAIW